MIFSRTFINVAAVLATAMYAKAASEPKYVYQVTHQSVTRHKGQAYITGLRIKDTLLVNSHLNRDGKTWCKCTVERRRRGRRASKRVHVQTCDVPKTFLDDCRKIMVLSEKSNQNPPKQGLDYEYSSELNPKPKQVDDGVPDDFWTQATRKHQELEFGWIETDASTSTNTRKPIDDDHVVYEAGAQTQDVLWLESGEIQTQQHEGSTRKGDVLEELWKDTSVEELRKRSREHEKRRRESLQMKKDDDELVEDSEGSEWEKMWDDAKKHQSKEGAVGSNKLSDTLGACLDLIKASEDIPAAI